MFYATSNVFPRMARLGLREFSFHLFGAHHALDCSPRAYPPLHVLTIAVTLAAVGACAKSDTTADYDRTFYQNVIQHHQEALTMVDAYLPKATNAMLKQMAETMKADQAKEIAEFQQKVARLGA